MISAEMQNALKAVSLGDQYMKANRGAQRAGRTRSLESLLLRGFIQHNYAGYGFMLTDKGRASLGKSSSETEVQP